MRCSECNHENTEGAWLCINCGTKLPRPEDQELGEDSRKVDEPKEVQQRDEDQFAPQISENLRKLRERTERERGRQVTVPRMGPFFDEFAQGLRIPATKKDLLQLQKCAFLKSLPWLVDSGL